jgi:hypothetical protein
MKENIYIQISVSENAQKTTFQMRSRSLGTEREGTGPLTSLLLCQLTGFHWHTNILLVFVPKFLNYLVIRRKNPSIFSTIELKILLFMLVTMEEDVYKGKVSVGQRTNSFVLKLNTYILYVSFVKILKERVSLMKQTFCCNTIFTRSIIRISILTE